MHNPPGRILRKLLMVARTAAPAALCMAVPLGATPAAASETAAAALVTCVGQQVTDYSPGLHLTQPRNVVYQADGTYASCPLNDGVSGVTYSEGGAVTGATCLAFPSTATATLTWSNGQHSTVQVTGTEIDVAGATQVYVSLGTVTSGRYAGSLVNVTTEIIPDLSNPLPCLNPTGLTHVSGLSTLAIL
ncbi:hypothetical protein DMH12_02065 [Streptomyces sp. WAC 04229]|uniref:hypothetical protein n=1 Tax=Streptomyces sp. WAC 04229 TaxID=2203206 RepID=UPI000F74BB20|nr:hypothetical protein [Streptomyces sp. WAC 04229]RSN64748.1 hypothetical protein DMH12_02065 [Streptomyces sp. WAC 04229]